jgi:phosphatidylserine/phosphatidylglycerophosphate/cardiolipin synthase-like enzyme
VAGIRRWRWPAEQRPPGGAVLHAKALVVDGHSALVGSANLTQRALTANLEVGVLVRDPAVAQAIEAHVHELVANGVLTRA